MSFRTSEPLKSESDVLEIFQGMGLIERYLLACREVTDAPLAYQAAAIISLIAGFANGVFVPAWGDLRRVNVWIMMVGPSGTGKGSAQRIANSIAREVGRKHVMPEDPTWPILVDRLKVAESGISIVEEMTRFIENLKQKFQGPLLWNLIELFDNPPEWEKARKGDGVAILVRPSYTIYGGTTIENFERHQNREHFAGGWYGRYLFLSAMKERRLGWRGLLRKEERDGIVRGLRQIMAAEGEMDVTPIDNAMREHGMCRRKAWPKLFEGLRNREEFYLIKLAAIFELSKHYGAKFTISEESFRAAAIWMELCKESALRIARAVTLLRSSDKYEIRRILEEHGGEIEERELCRRTPLLMKQLNNILKTLEWEGSATSRVEGEKYTDQKRYWTRVLEGDAYEQEEVPITAQEGDSAESTELGADDGSAPEAGEVERPQDSAKEGEVPF